MMKVAIPVFLDRISPRLDCARKLLVLEVEKDRILEKKELDISHWPPDKKIFYLREMGIKELICGGLRLQDRGGLRRFGIQVTSPLYGEVEAIIEAYINGNLSTSCCRAQKRRRRGRCI
jgi:predicted Fe-Mo cluster-binding NifX family protein